MTFVTVFEELNDIPLTNLMKSAPIPGNQSSFEILQYGMFDIWHYQSDITF